MRLRLSLTARLTVLFAVVSATVLIGFSRVVVSAIEQHFAALDHDELSGKILLIRNEIERIDSPAGLARLPDQLHDALVGHPDLYVTVVGSDRRAILSTPGPRIPDRFLDDGTATFDWQAQGHGYRGLSVAMATRIPGAAPLIVAVAIDTAHHTVFLARFDKTLTLFVVAATMISGLLGWLAARSGLAPLRVMRARAAAVTARKLDLRLPADSVPPEMADLAATLNDMLDRLEAAFRRLSDFSSDLAHELRTPISNLMMQTQVALAQARSAQDYRDILASNAEEFERLSRMVADMLFLAKADHGLMLPTREDIDLGREVRELFDFYEALADERHVALRCHGDGRMRGDRLMIRRALSNLMSNALRHTAADAEVKVSITSASDKVVIAVENAGNTIAAAQISRLFERFYRADEARARDDMQGAGLGLAIAKAIVDAHGGRIGVTSAEGRTRFVLEFPTP